jgi:hypothetical protein
LRSIRNANGCGVTARCDRQSEYTLLIDDVGDSGGGTESRRAVRVLSCSGVCQRAIRSCVANCSSTKLTSLKIVGVFPDGNCVRLSITFLSAASRHHRSSHNASSPTMPHNLTARKMPVAPFRHGVDVQRNDELVKTLSRMVDEAGHLKAVAFRSPPPFDVTDSSTCSRCRGLS